MTFIAAVNFSCVDIAATHVDKYKKIPVEQGGFIVKEIPKNEYEKRTLTKYQSSNTNSLFSFHFMIIIITIRRH